MLIEMSERTERVMQLVQERLLDGRSNEAIQVMRDNALSFSECMEVVLAATGCTINEAKRLVHFSSAWQDDRFQREAAADCLFDTASTAFDVDDGK